MGGGHLNAKRTITVIDYGFGNVRSVLNALERSGFEPKVVSAASEVGQSSFIVLPGVGAFGTAMRVISEKRFDQAIRESANNGAQILGICLGMQLLFEKSFEFGEHSGLGLLAGTVGPLVSSEKVSPEVKSTHISWARVGPKNSGRLAQWFSARPHDDYYFVHSYAAQSVPPDNIAGVSNYRGDPFVSAVEKGNVAGVQFHPERSGEVGLALLTFFFGNDS